MSHTAKLAREDAFTDALRVTDEAIGDEQPTPQALRIIEALKRLRDAQPARVPGLERVDYLAQVQDAARSRWALDWDQENIGPAHDATAGVDTPLGRLSATVWRERWNGYRGERIAWASEYSLEGEPITIAEIKAAGLAQKPTSRNRRKK